MKSTEVYKTLRLGLGAWPKELRFKRTASSMLGWHRPLGEAHLVLWFQCSQSGWDTYTGSQFTLEFQKGPAPEIGLGVNRLRYYKLLSADELEDFVQLQNRVIRGLTRPPRGHWSETMPPETKAWYHRQFEELKERPQRAHDLWFRYAGPSDVQAWAAFLAPLMPSLISRFEAHPPVELGSGA